ncbi:MAG: Mitochondrial ATPase complex subunit atp10 [Bathelium mastoideum]|nr:MAG: Mitochondrial ATPase complex subunit atp10 [Bathelium mastoideum]
MSNPGTIALLRLSALRQSSPCIRCQLRLRFLASSSSHLYAANSNTSSSSKPSRRPIAQPLEYRSPPSKSQPSPPGAANASPSSTSTSTSPSLSSSPTAPLAPLGRPIGVPFPPSPGENSGLDRRPWRERYADSLSREQNRARRRQLQDAMFRKPYFRDWTRLGQAGEGKTFVANARLFRADAALWFPNLVGETLAVQRRAGSGSGSGSGAGQDTTAVLRGRVSVVGVYSSEWAYRQVESFWGREANAEIGELLGECGNVAQRVDVNVEESAVKYWILRPFLYRLRKERDEKDHGKYFIVRKGITDELRESIGLLNSKVGYVYLLDGECRIRWAGSGLSLLEEREGMVKGLRKLIQEARECKEDEREKTQLDKISDTTPGEPMLNQGREPEKQAAAANL